MDSYLKRTLFDVVLVIGIFTLPWYATVILSIIGVFLFESFYEYLVINTVVYALYGGAGLGVFSDPLVYAIIIIGLFIGITELRRSVIFYSL